MKLLLDTHIWLWYLLGDSRLSDDLKERMDHKNNSLWLSSISIWETLLLAEKGRIILQPDPVQWIRNSQQQLDTQEVPVSHEIAILSRQLTLEHQDPADRFIAATAVHLNLILVTVDSRLTQAAWLQTLS